MKTNNKMTLMLYIFFLSVILALLFIKFIGNKYGKVLISYGGTDAKRIVTLIVNNAIIFNKNDDFINDIFIIERDANNNIKNLDLNVLKSNKLLDSINEKITNDLVNISNGNIDNTSVNIKRISDIDYNNFKNGFVNTIPFGTLMGNGLISNVGPKIPIKVILIGDVNSTISSNVKDYGINNALIEVKVNVNVSVLVSVLLNSKKVNVNISRVIAMKIIQGDIPNYYLSGN